MLRQPGGLRIFAPMHAANPYAPLFSLCVLQRCLRWMLGALSGACRAVPTAPAVCGRSLKRASSFSGGSGLWARVVAVVMRLPCGRLLKSASSFAGGTARDFGACVSWTHTAGCWRHPPLRLGPFAGATAPSLSTAADPLCPSLLAQSHQFAATHPSQAGAIAPPLSAAAT